MHNPFVLLTTRLLESLIKAGNTFFVRQTYKRGKNEMDPLNKAAFLFTHYTDYSRAKTTTIRSTTIPINFYII